MMVKKRMMKKEEIEKILQNVNRELKAIELDPIQFFDDGWRYVIDGFEISLVLDAIADDLSYVPSLELFLSLAYFDIDMEGEYYWVPYSSLPAGVVTPAMRFMALK